MKFFIRIALLTALFTGAGTWISHAQGDLPEKTVEWTSSVKQLGDSQFEVIFTGEILPGWHTYDLHSDVSSTTVEYEPQEGLSLVGEPYEIGTSVREFNDIFEVEMGTYADRIVIGQKVTLTAEGATLKGLINWRSCRDELCLSPEDWIFEVPIGEVFECKKVEGEQK